MPRHKTENDSISFLLSAITKRMRDQRAARLTAIGVSAGQDMLLWQLWQQDGLAQSQLVERLCIQPSTVSKMLDRMEKSGLVTRNPDIEDSRITRIELTQQGRDLEQRVCDIWRNTELQILESFSIEERVLLRRLLLQVHTNLLQEP